MPMSQPWSKKPKPLPLSKNSKLRDRTLGLPSTFGARSKRRTASYPNIPRGYPGGHSKYLSKKGAISTLLKWHLEVTAEPAFTLPVRPAHVSFDVATIKPNV